MYLPDTSPDSPWCPRRNSAGAFLAVGSGVARPLPSGCGELGTRERSLSILAVDDAFLVLASAVAMFEDLGHRVTAAYSGKGALAAPLRDRRLELPVRS